jgi:NTE family protein
MNAHVRPNFTVAARSVPFERVALVLQGGGALGAYQAGVYEALAEAGIHPDWVAGVSIGAINGALIAGNPPEARVDKLRAFWEGVSASPHLDWMAQLLNCFGQCDATRQVLNHASAISALVAGASGFFDLRLPPPWFRPAGSMDATSFYDTSGLATTLERLIDFDRINAGNTRLSLGAVNVRTGNFVYFDTTTHRIGPRHVIASGALPPGFPAVEIEGEHYWDGGLVSNTPLQWVAESSPRLDTLAFQVDLWNARGELPRDMAEVATRHKEIQYSSRTRAGTDMFKYIQRIRRALADLQDKLPDELRNTPEAQFLQPVADRKVYNLVHLIYRAKSYEGHSKDYDFSRSSMREHWRAGYHDAVRTLRHPEVLARPIGDDGLSIFDLAQDGRE